MPDRTPLMVDHAATLAHYTTELAKATAQPECTWQQQAADDRDAAIATLRAARQQISELRALLNTYDMRLAGELGAFQRSLDERLGALLVARADAES